MNRIILIGNGFDLAHGLKTSYADFIDWYWRQQGLYLLHGRGRIVEDDLCFFKLLDKVGLAEWFYVWGHHYMRENPFEPWDECQIVEIAKQDRDLCDFQIKSSLFERIHTEFEKGWVDIENVYYALLKKSSNPKQLNDDLDLIKGKLIEYLNELQESFNSSDILIPNIREQIFDPFSKEDIAIDSMDKYDDELPNRIVILNFNYTKTADTYIGTKNFAVNHIHGSLSKPESVIFGYGDERDDEYNVLMKKNDNEYLRHIKSFRYLEAPNYRKMLSFIESAPYQICIMGHSCGLSDRTLLATLFEHPNCVSIKPYYYKKEDGTDNYRELVQNIARNFKDPSLMRDRVVRKDRCEALGINEK